MSMKGETAIVTGSTSGIGKKIAELFLREGCKVVICSRNEENVNKTVSVFQEQFGESVIGMSCDVSDILSIKNVVDKTITNFGSIRILVANAGVNLSYGPFEKMTMDQVTSYGQKVIGINLLGMINSITAVLPQMMKQEYGRLITLSGGGVSRPISNMTLYSASKGGVETFSKCLAEDLKSSEKDIKINIFRPGMIKTNLGKNSKIIGNWRDEDEFLKELELVYDYIGTDINQSCSKVIPYALSSCKDNGKAFRGFSIWKMIRGGRKLRKKMKTIEN